MACVKGCAPQAIPYLKEDKTVSIQIEDKTYTWSDVHMGKCTLSYHGGDSTVSPFIHKTFPGWNIDVKKQDFSEEAAYKFCWTLSTAKWRKTAEFPHGYVIPGHGLMHKWGVGGSFGVEGSRGCMRSCFHHLEKTGKAGQHFENKDFIRRPRWVLPVKSEGVRT
jgi:hypothetical protein